MQWMVGIPKKKISRQELPELTMLARHLAQMTLLLLMEKKLECQIKYSLQKRIKEQVHKLKRN